MAWGALADPGSPGGDRDKQLTAELPQLLPIPNRYRKTARTTFKCL